MTDHKPGPSAETALEASEEARQLWDDIQIICNGAGTFTPEQVDGYVVSRIAQAFAEVIHQRNAAFFHIGDVWAQRNQAVRERDELQQRLEAVKRGLDAANAAFAELTIEFAKLEAKHG